MAEPVPAAIPGQTRNSNSKYRPEIDGLRAFAVVAVIINHFNADVLPSGYLGVDVFFVISGYVITSSLADRKSKNFLDFVTGFYERRVKRLIPALLVFVLVTGTLICLVDRDPRESLEVGAKALFGFSNIHFFRASANYFAQSMDLNPFTHTWSLGVEEQFYFLFPFLIWFSGFGRQKVGEARNLFLLVGALTIASLVAFISLYRINQPAAYYLMPSRFWEMAAGCLIFIGFQKRAKVEQILEQVPPLLVLVAIVGVMFLPLEAAVPATMAIVVLSAVLIACLKPGTVAHFWFSHGKVVSLGMISYSLYLWHWAVLCISRWTIGIHWWSVPFQLGLMILLAAGSYAAIEKPFRAMVFPSRAMLLRVGVLSLGGAAALLFLGGKVMAGRLYRARYPFQDLMARSRQRSHPPIYTGNQCHLPRDANVLPSGCSLKGSGSKSIYFLGNSHTDHYREAHFLLNKKLGLRIDGVSVSACTFPPDPRQNDCGPIQEKQKMRVLNALKAGDIVAISNRYVLSADRYGWIKDDASRSSLHAFASEVMARGGKVVLFGPLPEFRVEAKQCTKLWFRPVLASECETSPSAMAAKRSDVSLQLANLDTRIFLFDPMKSVCPSDRCRLIDDEGKPIFQDSNHLSDYANRRYIYPALKDFLESKHLL